jgi:glycosyltransferase involved in cell wall biosynthesis
LDLRPLRQLIQACRRYQVAIWHGHDYKTNLFGLIARRAQPMRLVTTVHGWVSQTGRTPLYYAVDRIILRFYDEVVCVSEDLRDVCLKHGVRSDRCHLIRNAIDTEAFSRKMSVREAKQQLGAPEGSTLIGGVGRLMDEKGFDILIEAVRGLVREGADLHLWIAGEGPERRKLEALGGASSLGARLRLLGNVSDPRLLFSAMDIFALSSRREGLPNVLLEAMAMGVPVVATAVAGVPLLVEDGTTGLLVDPDSPQELTRALGRLVEDPERAHTMARQARIRIEEDFSFRDRMTKVARVYDRLLH